MDILLSALFGYLIGSIPFGLVLCAAFGYGDIRNIGSGNIGATNVLRTGNKPLALATLLLDSGKGAIAVLLAYWIQKNFPHPCTLEICAEGATDCGCPSYVFSAISSYACLAGFFAILGHLYPVWLKFKGGKGVATTLGTLIALAPPVGIMACGIWSIMAGVFKYSSLAALVAVMTTPLMAHYIYGNPNLSGLCAAVAFLVWIKHRPNIKRLMSGEEPKIGQKK